MEDCETFQPRDALLACGKVDIPDHIAKIVDRA